MKKMNNKKGFTLAELLIVVAIIAVLVAISIPIFTTQLEKAREATDMANVRSAYAEVVADYLTNGQEAATATVTAVQTQDGWQNTDLGKLNARVDGKESEITVPASTSGWTVKCAKNDSGVATITVEANS